MGLRRDERVMLALLVLVPATLVSAALRLPSGVQFFLSIGSVVPLAAFVGLATEELTGRFGGRIGGLLNATFGNAPDILVGVFGVQKGLIVLVKATLVGALISNSALIMGICFLAAGIAHGRPRFDRREAGHHSVLMLLTVGALLLPTVGAFALCSQGQCSGAASSALVNMSVAISVILLIAYAAYVALGVFGVGGGREAATREAQATERGSTRWPVWISVAVLAAATAALIPIVDVLTSSVAATTSALGWTEIFVGIVVVANAGNAAEAYAAIRLAIKGPPAPSSGTDSGLDLALSIASASSIQIATFVLPAIVLLSLMFHRLTLAFSTVEVAILALLALIFGAVAHDGESNWLEGVQLLALYAMAGVLFFVLPLRAFTG